MAEAEARPDNARRWRALADRIHVLRREREQAQERTLAAAQLAERELEQRVTERTEELLKANSQLRRNNLQLELLASNASDVISRRDAENRYLYVSAACRSMLGYEPEELLGHTFEEFVHPNDHGIAQLAYRKITDGPDNTCIDIRFRHRDGHYLWVETNLRVVRDEDGNPVETIAVTRDITESRRVRQRARGLICAVRARATTGRLDTTPPAPTVTAAASIWSPRR